MTRFLFSAVSAGSLLVVGLTVFSADAPKNDGAAMETDAGQTVGLIDIARVIKNYPPLIE